MDYTTMNDLELAAQTAALIEELNKRAMLSAPYAKAASGIKHYTVKVAKERLLEQLMAEKAGQ